MGSWLIGVSCLEVEVRNPSILKTEHPARHLLSVGARPLPEHRLARSALPRERIRSLATIRREQPQLSLDWIRANVPYQTAELMERYLEGFRKAGLGEK
jgi:hypothetical protein